MSKSLIVVESPAKAKTINKYLGKDYVVLASYGHVRDLVAKEGAIDTDHGFSMRYNPIEKNQGRFSDISKALKNADTLYLATDPDREGEAIAWHLYEMLKDSGAAKNKEIKRVIFHEVTESAIKLALANPGDISMNLVNAQQARRALDYLVGFNISPLLWRKIRRGLSAGRVQSPALRLIAERELEIAQFVSQEYWTIEGDLTVNENPFGALLSVYKNEKIKQFSVTSAEQAAEIESYIKEKSQGTLTVTSLEKKTRSRNPSPPFITSTLQQEASRRLGFTAQHTMRVAQQLYEGIDIGDMTVGLITYMRTDSVTLAEEALDEIRRVIAEKYGSEYLPSSPRKFKTKSKNAQEAHEAIRPTLSEREPDAIGSKLTADQLKLYRLIWNKTISCQMISAKIDTVAADLEVEAGTTLRATGSTIVEAGFLRVYDDHKEAKGDDSAKMLPEMKKGERISLIDIKGKQHFTEPPPRFSEASLIKALEEYGIGRPSTYASIISTLQNREYVTIDQKRFYPTDVGMVVSKFLTNYLQQYVDYEFTAHLEDDLDAVARGDTEWVPLMEKFWRPFIDKVHEIDESVDRHQATEEPIDENCPECNSGLVVKLGRRGKFIACTGYPECSYTRNLDGEDNKEGAEIVEGRVCPECSSDLIVRNGKFGKFIGCSAYPDCRYLEPLNKPKNTGVTCPECKIGQILERKSRRGKTFFSCDRYPDCGYAIWNPPLNESCPSCGHPILTQKTTKKRGVEKVCPKEGCDFIESMEVKI